MEQHAPFFLHSKGAGTPARLLMDGVAVAWRVLAISPGSGDPAIATHGFCARTAFWSLFLKSRHDN